LILPFDFAFLILPFGSAFAFCPLVLILTLTLLLSSQINQPGIANWTTSKAAGEGARPTFAPSSLEQC